MNKGQQISTLRFESTEMRIKYQVFQSALHMSANSRDGLCVRFSFCYDYNELISIIAETGEHKDVPTMELLCLGQETAQNSDRM